VIPPDADPGLVHNNSATGKLRYEFDRVFDSNCTQEEIFNTIAKDKILGVLDGFSCTIFAYGQTGSGKTFTIFGGDSYSVRGLIPRSLGLLFGELKIRKKTSASFVFKCQISFTEIYNETVYDLLDQNRVSTAREDWAPVQLLESVNGLVLKNLNVYDVETEEEALQLFFMGNNSRLTSSTSMNSISSRSHAVFTILLECEGIKTEQTVFTSSKINMVDLAGSERMYKVIIPRSEILSCFIMNNTAACNPNITTDDQHQGINQRSKSHQLVAPLLRTSNSIFTGPNLADEATASFQCVGKCSCSSCRSLW
jgi:kinesin family member 6/9